jgi:hypothetical protein
MAEAVHTHHAHDRLSGASYEAPAGGSSRRSSSWRASVFLLAGALVVLSVMFGSNEDSSVGQLPSTPSVAQR